MTILGDISDAPHAVRRIDSARDHLDTAMCHLDAAIGELDGARRTRAVEILDMVSAALSSLDRIREVL